MTKTSLLTLTFSGAEKRTKETSTLPKAPPVYGGGAIDSGQRPPYIKVLVWLTKPVPLRGEPWISLLAGA